MSAVSFESFPISFGGKALGARRSGSRIAAATTVESKLMASTNVKVVPFRTLSTGSVNRRARRKLL